MCFACIVSHVSVIFYEERLNTEKGINNTKRWDFFLHPLGHCYLNEAEEEPGQVEGQEHRHYHRHHLQGDYLIK